MTTAAPVLVHHDGIAGIITLNRPDSINALTHEMVGIIDRTLRAWEDDESVQTVVLTGTGSRGLCAGGDIVALWRDAKAKGTEAAAFWRDEYTLNAYIASYPKPYVAIMDGIVLGGGIGLSAHGNIRVVTEHSDIGMPETGIGFIPDVGGTWLLSKAPGELGTHLGLTAGSVGAGDAIAIGFADAYVPVEKLPDLMALLTSIPAAQAVASLAETPPDSDLVANRTWIDSSYASDDLGEIITTLYAGGNHAAAAARLIESRSPTSVHVTLRALRQARSLDSLGSALNTEFRLAMHCHAHPDFVEGIRSQLIDRDRNPSWEPGHISEVSPAVVDAFFDPLESGELGLPSN